MTSSHEPADNRGNLRYYLLGLAVVAVIAVIAAISYAVQSNNLEEQLAQLQREHQQSVAALTTERDTARDERQAAQGDLDRLRATVQDEQRLAGEVNRGGKKTQPRQQQLQDLNAQSEAAQAQIQTIQQQRAEAEQQANQLAEQTRQHTQQLERVTAQLGETGQQQGAAREQLAALTEQIAQRTAETEQIA